MSTIVLETATVNLATGTIVVMVVIYFLNLLIGGIGFARAGKHSELQLWASLSIIFAIFFPPFGIVFGGIAWVKSNEKERSNS